MLINYSYCPGVHSKILNIYSLTILCHDKHMAVRILHMAVRIR